MLAAKHVVVLLSTLATRAAWVTAYSFYQGLTLSRSYPYDVDNYTRGLFINASEHPNATRSIAFKPFQGYTDMPDLKDEQWIWRVNVTDFAVPDVKQVEGRASLVDPRIVSTIWDFAWPRGGNLSSALRNSTNSFCITTLQTLNMPANVSNGFTEENTDSTDCTAVLGAECVDAMVTNLFQSRVGACRSLSHSWNNLPECASTIAYTVKTHPLSAVVTGDINDGNSTTTITVNGTGIPSPNLASSQGFRAEVTAAFNGSNTTEYLKQVNELQILMIDPVLLGTLERGRNLPLPQLLCTRVNTTVLPANDTNGDGFPDTGTGDNSTGSGSRENMGLSMKYNSGPMLTFMASLLLVTFAFVV